jgi:hypothetical protein
LALLPSNLRLLIALHKRLRFEGPVLTLGTQNVLATYADLRRYFDEMTCSYAEPETIELDGNPERAAWDWVHARTFFAMLGIRDYADLDKYGDEGASILHDLNDPVGSELSDRFGLILDSGTIEHVFDIRRALENVARMTAVGGWAVHISPMSNFIDHGFYSLNPVLFFDFYEANGFADSGCFVFQVDPLDHLGYCPCFEYTYGMPVMGLIKEGMHTACCFFTRKLERRAEFRVPTQGAYDPERPEVGPSKLWKVRGDASLRTWPI